MQMVKDALVRVALDLGFSAVGVAPADADQGDVLRQWVDAGAHAGMGWMERHVPARLDPQLVLEGARSIIMLSYEYARVDASLPPVRVARYAQGVDYHKLLAPKLGDLDELLQLWGGSQRCFSDSGPVSERFFAQQAGLGWIGRHGLLIRKKLGSYCVLASIVSTLELPYDAPHVNYCGNCRRCLDACPTGAIAEGRVCDARKCLSYWTIEAKEDMPPDIAAAAPERIFGCDICQEACPWNQRAALSPLSVDPHFLMPYERQQVGMADLQRMGVAEFEQLFQASPLRRAGLPRLQANCCALLTPPPSP